jgi:hypothetical protein
MTWSSSILACHVARSGTSGTGGLLVAASIIRGSFLVGLVVVRSDRAAPISSVVARSVPQSRREVRFGTPLPGQEAVGAADLPHVAVGIGERAGVSPFLVSGFDDDLGAGILRATHRLLDRGS